MESHKELLDKSILLIHRIYDQATLNERATIDLYKDMSYLIDEVDLAFSKEVKLLKAMEDATVIDYCNEVIEIFELPNHSNNAWKKAIIENAIEKMQEVLLNFKS